MSPQSEHPVLCELNFQETYTLQKLVISFACKVQMYAAKYHVVCSDVNLQVPLIIIRLLMFLRKYLYLFDRRQQRYEVH